MKRFHITFAYSENGKQTIVSQSVSMNDTLTQLGNAKYNENLESMDLWYCWSITIIGETDETTHECFFCKDGNGNNTLKPSHVITYKGDRIVSEDKFSVAVRK